MKRLGKWINIGGMDKLYYTDPYLKTLKCTVTGVVHTEKATEVKTDRTIFYPESGGQPGDRGTIGDHVVLDTRKGPDGDSILILGPSSQIKETEALELALDWDHRYFFMVMHSAQHLLSGLMFYMFGIGTVAVHQGEEYLTIETDRSEISSETVDGLVLAANAKIRENHRILYHEMSHSDAEALGLRRSIKVEGDVRIVEIEDVDRIACGGVHVARTGEIGLIYCMGHEQIRGHVRLYFNCGQKALQCLLDENKVIGSLNRTFSCHTDELEEKIGTLSASLTESKAQLAKAQRKLAKVEIEDKADKDGVCTLICEEGADLQSYAQIVPEFSDLAMLVLCPDNSRTKWLIALKGKYEKIDFNSLIRPQLAKIDAKGGGRSPIFQGVANCSDDLKLTAFLNAFREIARL